MKLPQVAGLCIYNIVELTYLLLNMLVILLQGPLARSIFQWRNTDGNSRHFLVVY